MIFRVGLDIGSTTVKIAVLGENDDLVYSEYKRHFANIKETISEVISKLAPRASSGPRSDVQTLASSHHRTWSALLRPLWTPFLCNPLTTQQQDSTLLLLKTFSTSC